MKLEIYYVHTISETPHRPKIWGAGSNVVGRPSGGHNLPPGWIRVRDHSLMMSDFRGGRGV